MRVLVTGVAGYIGAHQCRLLVERGIERTAVDDHPTGVRERVAGLKLYDVNLQGPDAPKLVSEILRNKLADLFVPLAASKRIDDSLLHHVPQLGDTIARNLTPIAIAAEAPGEASLNYGSNHPIDDGTCARDDVHVPGQSDAHLAALTSIGRRKELRRLYNVSTCRGARGADGIYGIRRRLPGGSATPIIGPRQSSDAAVVVADVGQIGRKLGWTSQRGLREILDSAVGSHRQRTAAGEGGHTTP